VDQTPHKAAVDLLHLNTSQQPVLFFPSRAARQMNQGGLLCCKQTRPKLHGAKREQASQFSQNGAAT